MEVVIESMVEGSRQVEEGRLNPFKEQLGETLPKDVERNYNNFFIRKNAILFKVDSEKLVNRIALLKDHILIARFMGTKPDQKALNSWFLDLNKKLREGSLTLSRNARKGFFFLKVVRKMSYTMP